MGHFTKHLALAEQSAPELEIPFQEAADEKGHCSFRGSLMPTRHPRVSRASPGDTASVPAQRQLREHQVLSILPRAVLAVETMIRAEIWPS